MSLKDCFGYRSEQDCACLCVMKCYGTNKCNFYKTHKQLELEQEKTDKRLNKLGRA